MKIDNLIDKVLDNYNVESTPQVREMLKDFIACDLDWFKENFVEEQDQIKNEDEDGEYDDLEEFAYHAPHDQSICGRGDQFSYYDNCFR